MTKSTGIIASLKRSFRRNRQLEAAPGFHPASGLRYVTFFERLHAQAAFDWYMEIGCRSGQIFGHARGRTIAVDPFFQIERNVIGPKPAMFAFQQTSDDFFASGFLERNAIRLSVSFLDGMHLFEFLLRDFMNTEDRSREDGVILMHDCSPYDHVMTSRDYSGRDGLPWTGDVWKLLPILQEHRPDLTVEVLDCSPTGLVLVRGLSPGNRVLRDRYDAIVRAYADLALEAYGVERFFASFAHVDAAAEAEAGFPRFRPVKIEASQPQRSSP